MNDESVDVLIVGAGPTGLTLACLFARLGISFSLIEAKPHLSDRSKALVVQARTLELFEKLGLAEEALKRGHEVEGLDYWVRGKLQGKLDISRIGEGLTPYPRLLVLEQDKTEALLYEDLVSRGGKANFSEEVVSFRDELDGRVLSTVHGAGGHERKIRSRYVLGADGARSIVRRHAGLEFQGGTYETHFVLADLKIDGPLDHNRVSIAFSEHGMAGFFPMVGTDRFRVFGPVPEALAQELDQKMDFERVARQLQLDSGIDLRFHDEKWVSVYRLHHRCVEKFRNGRYFVVGDAAHVHSPVGAQGMNTGIQDAFNLGWKLAAVLKGRAPETLLDSYDLERRPWAERLVKTTDRAFSFVTKSSWWARLGRLEIGPRFLPFLFTNPTTKKFIFNAVSEIGIAYPRSPLSAQYGMGDLWSPRAPKPGDRLPEIRLMSTGQSLRELTREVAFHFVLIEESFDDGIDGFLGDLVFKYDIRVHRIRRHDLVDAANWAPAGYTSAYLIRPDDYIAFRAAPFRPAEFDEYLNQSAFADPSLGSKLESSPQIPSGERT